MSNDLVSPEDLSAFPDAPFADEVVDAAVAELRASAGWHIAPERTETITLDSEGGTLVTLPSLRVVAVSAVRDVCGEVAMPVAGFRWSRSGVMHGHCWPQGFQSLEVDLTHGYETCPGDLLPVVAAIAQGIKFNSSVSQQSAGPFAQTATNLSTLGSWLDRSIGGTLSRYRIAARP